MNPENVISRIFPVGKYKFLSMRYIFIKHLWKWKNGSFLKRNHNEAFFSFSFRSSGLSYRFHNRILMKNKNHIRITRRVMGSFRILHFTKMGLSLWHLTSILISFIIRVGRTVRRNANSDVHMVQYGVARWRGSNILMAILTVFLGNFRPGVSKIISYRTATHR